MVRLAFSTSNSSNGAVTRSDYRSQLVDEGFVDIEIIDDHTVADGLSSVFVKARMPASPEEK
jgi:hypothetical protein